MESKKYYVQDIETGYKYELSKEQYEVYLAAWEVSKDKIKGYNVPIIFGATGDLDKGEAYYNGLFFNLKDKI